MPGEKIELRFHLDCVLNQCTVEIRTGDQTRTKKWRFDASVWSLCRVQFRTKYRLYHQDEEVYAKWADIGNLPGADAHTPALEARIYSLTDRTIEPETN